MSRDEEKKISLKDYNKELASYRRNLANTLNDSRVPGDVKKEILYTQFLITRSCRDKNRQVMDMDTALRIRENVLTFIRDADVNYWEDS